MQRKFCSRHDVGRNDARDIKSHLNVIVTGNGTVERSACWDTRVAWGELYINELNIHETGKTYLSTRK